MLSSVHKAERGGEKAEILLTGATGFLGRYLLTTFARAGHVVHAVVPAESQPALKALIARLGREDREAAGRVIPITGELSAPALGLESAAMEALVPRVGWVVNCASLTGLDRPESLMEDVNVKGTDQLLAFAHRLRGLRMFAHVSSIFVSGDYPGRFYEDWLDVGQPISNPVARSKMAAEQHVRAAMRTIPAVVFRPGFLVGDAETGACDEDRGLFPLYSLVRRADRSLPPGVPLLAPDGPDRYVPISPNDWAAEAVLAILSDHGAPGTTFCLVDPRPPTVRELVDHLSESIGRPIYRIPVALFTKFPLLGPGRILGSSHAVTRRFGGSPISLYFLLLRNEYDTTNTSRALESTRIRCPSFETYLDRFYGRFVEEHG